MLQSATQLLILSHLPLDERITLIVSMKRKEHNMRLQPIHSTNENIR